MTFLALKPAGSCTGLGLNFDMIPPGTCMPVNIPWTQKFSGGPTSWTLCSQPGGPGSREPQQSLQPTMQDPTVNRVQTEKKGRKGKK